MHRSVRLSTLGVALAALAIISYHLLPSARAAASAGDSDLARLSNPDWTTPIAPFRIVGNLYYVGSRDLASYLIVISHAHWDHDAGSAELKRHTGAQYMVMDDDVPVVESGGAKDFQYPDKRYPATRVDRVHRSPGLSRPRT